MCNPLRHTGVYWISLALIAGSLVFCLLQFVDHAAYLLERPGVLALLCAAAFAASRTSAPDRTAGSVRLAPAFVMAGMLVLPSPAGVLIALAALAGGPGGLVGRRSRDLPVLASAASAAILAQLIASNARAFSIPGTLGSFLLLAVLFVNLQGIALAAGSILGQPRVREFTPVGSPAGRALLMELLNIPLAWLLAGSLSGDHPAVNLIVAGVLVLLAGWSLRKLAYASDNLRSTNDSLAARVTELATLHAIGREIVSSLDLRRVFQIIERECRKIVDVDRFSIALVDPDTGELVSSYRRNRGETPQETKERLREGIECKVAAEKRTLRRGRAFGTEEGEFPSLLAAPLIVEERVVGVLVIRSRSPEAYDGHQMSVVTTIAQQAAVAIENARHHKMATTDALTGLFLKDYFFRRVEEEYHRARRYEGTFGILMIDLDGFKRINDRYGHLAADQYLQSLGTEIRGSLRSADLASRFGGDEFCLLLPETDLAGARTIAERLRASVEGLHPEVEGRFLRATVSVGIAAFPDHDTGDLPGLLRRADQALYRAKRKGKNCVIPFTSRKEPERNGARPTAPDFLSRTS